MPVANSTRSEKSPPGCPPAILRDVLTTPQFAAARAIVARLRDDGHQAYFAGGCVRDLLLGREPKDYDVATSATPDIVLDLFPRTFAVGAHFGVVLVSDESRRAHRHPTEVATFRSDGAYSDGRHPDAVRYTPSARRRRPTPRLHHQRPAPRSTACKRSLEEPFSDPSTLRAAILDYVGGLADLDAGILRAIGQPNRRFDEDHLRMLRAVRFAARFDFEIDPPPSQPSAPWPRRFTPSAASASATSSPASSPKAAPAAPSSCSTQPACSPKSCPKSRACTASPSPRSTTPKATSGPTPCCCSTTRSQARPLTLAWGALLHDIGKPATYQPPTDPGDRIRFNGHVEVGVAIAAEICRRLRFSNEETTQILALIENHMRFGDILRMKAATLKRFFRLDRFPEHLALHRMDCNASHGSLDNYNLARQQYQAIPEEEVRPTPLLTGRDLITLGYHPGPSLQNHAPPNRRSAAGRHDSLIGRSHSSTPATLPTNH